MSVRLIPEEDYSPCRGFSVLELLIVVLMVLLIIGSAVTTMLRAQKPVLRTNATRQFVNYLQQARSDSMRRRATELSLMAQVTILNDRYYFVTLDANGDGALDTPVVVSLAEQHVTFKGPFPRVFTFDAAGRTVDSNLNVIHPAAITIANASGASMVKLSDAGQPSLAQP